jgi:hypothetical protein
MDTVVFSAGFTSYNINHIIYAGPAGRVPEDRRTNAVTHSFKIITSLGVAYCGYKSEEDARQARERLENMLESHKKALFRHGFETLDPRAIVSFGSTLQLKKPQRDRTHAIIVTMRSCDQQKNAVWLLFKSEESARAALRGLYGVMKAANEAAWLKPSGAHEPLVNECCS